MLQQRVWNCILIANIIYVSATPPPAHTKKVTSDDKYPPKYKYSYDISTNDDGTKYGQQESRDGEYAHGRYYVNLPRRGATSQVQYFADDWGYHPIFEYSTTNAHSKVSAQFALGERAVKALKNAQQTGSNTTQTSSSLTVESAEQPNTTQPQQYILQTQSNNPFLIPVIFTSSLPIYDQQSIQLVQQTNNLNQEQTQIAQPNVEQTSAELASIQEDINSNRVSNPKDNTIPEQSQTKGVQNVFILSNGNNESASNEINKQEQLDVLESAFTIDNNGYGLKLTALQRPTYNFLRQARRYNNRNNNNIEGYTKLVQNTKDLVTGADVLNINSAVETNLDDISKNITNSEQLSIDNNVQFIEQANPANILAQPIVVADLSGISGKSAGGATENYFSSTESAIETGFNNNPTETNVISITPRPLDIRFLAPITAALRIQNAGEKIENFITNDDKIENNENVKELSNSNNVEIQKSIPIYIGKYEFFDKGNENVEQKQESTISQTNIKTEVPPRIEYHYKEHPTQSVDNESSQSAEVHATAKQNTVVSGVRAMQVAEEHESLEVYTPIEQDLDTSEEKSQKSQQVHEYPTENQQKIIENPVTAANLINKPYLLQLPESYTAENTQFINTPLPVPVSVQVPVEIPIPVDVEKIIEKPVTKVVENPYQVGVSVSQPVTIPLNVPQPYSFDITKYIEKPFPKLFAVPIPHPVPVPITKLISVPFEVPKYIERIVDRPVPIKQYIDRPYPVYIQIPKGKLLNNRFKGLLTYAPIYNNNLNPKHLSKHFNKQQAAQHAQHSQHAQHAQHTQHAQHSQHSTVTKTYAEVNHKNCDNYFGPIPPPIELTKSRRNASPQPNPQPVNRLNFGKNLRIEYGFKPPMQPSIETDEHGNPLQKDDN